MKLKNLFDGYWLMTVLVIIALVMLTIRVVYTAKNKGKPETIKEPQKIIVPVLTPTTRVVDFETSYPLWQLLPYAGDGFVVEKYAEPLVLKVSLKKGEKGTVTKAVAGWIEKNGINPETHKIVWE